MSPLALCNISLALECPVGPILSQLLSYTFPLIVVTDSTILYMYIALFQTGII